MRSRCGRSPAWTSPIRSGGTADASRVFSGAWIEISASAFSSACTSIGEGVFSNSSGASMSHVFDPKTMLCLFKK